MLAAMALGADGVQIGSLFATSAESSAHTNFKQKIIETGDGGTKVVMKKVVPVRLIKNEFFNRIQQAQDSGASAEELKEMLGRGRAKLGMFEGDTKEGELEIGQVSGVINDVKSSAKIIKEVIEEFNFAKKELSQIHF